MVKIKIDNIIRNVCMDQGCLNIIGYDMSGRRCIVAKHSFTTDLLDHVLNNGKIRTNGHTYSKV